jgi:hypothetical protein
MLRNLAARLFVPLFVAGLVEGVFRQLVNDVPTRYGLATLFAFLWAAYFLYEGRKAR